MPSFSQRRLPITCDPPFRPTNPSVTSFRGETWLIVRLLNYRLVINEYGYFQCLSSEYSSHGTPVFRTRNFLLRLDAAGEVAHQAEIARPADWPEPLYFKNLGFEDCRLFGWNDALWVVATIREIFVDGKARMVLARIDRPETTAARFADWRVLDPGPPSRDEKNWMPMVDGNELFLAYNLDPLRLVDRFGATRVAGRQRHAAGNVLRGGSQLIPFDDGWLGLAHEQVVEGRRFVYYHRLVWIDSAYRLSRLTRRFYLVSPGVEFAAGLCRSADARKLTFSFGVTDYAAHLASLDAAEVCSALSDELPQLAGGIVF